MSTNPGAMDFPEALAPGARVGRWRVVERLGVGGQGAVYLVEDLEHPGDHYALKFALYARDRRAEREVVLVMDRAVHPHVVRFHECARWPHPREGRLGFIMDFVPGQALDVWAESEGTSFRQLAQAGATVARTLGELHARGVLHRDLKPEHIRMREPDRQPMLLDFGVGWYAGAAPLTTGPLPPATLYLLSPEAVRFLWRSSERPGGGHYAFQPGDDLYALGVCLYRATTGHYPFSEFMPMGLLQYAIVHSRPTAPALVNPRVPRALSEVIERLLSKDPAARPPSGEALHAALVEAASGGDAAWDADIFVWEEVPPSRPGELPERALVRPPKPTPPLYSSPPAAPVERPSPWSRGLVLTLAALLALVSMLRAPQAPSARVSEGEWPADGWVGPASSESEEAPRPARSQKLAPCTPKLEVELSGACWHSIAKRQSPDCPPQTVAYKGECLWPVPKPHSVPTSVDGGAPEIR